MRHRDGAGLLRVIDEVTLGEVVGVRPDDLDRVLVRPDGPVRAQSVEHALEASRVLDVVGGVDLKAGMGDVIDNTDREVVLGAFGLEIVEHGLDHRRREFFGTESVATAHDPGPALVLVPFLLHGFTEGGADVDVQRFTDRARFLGAVQHGHDFA